MATETLDDDLQQSLAAHDVVVTASRHGMCKLDACPTGPGFNKPRTNVLLQPARGRWRAWVDEDLRYRGDDPRRRRMFGDVARKGWRELNSGGPLEGDLNAAVRQVLDLLDSPLPPAASHPDPPDEQDLAELFAGAGRLLGREELAPQPLVPTAGQRLAMATATAAIGSRRTPAAAVLLGPSGCGKTAAAHLAAAQVIEQGVVEHVVQLEGSWLASGVLHWSERDDRVRKALEAAAGVPRLLILLEQFDLLLVQSRAADPLLAAGLDRGVKIIAVCSPGVAREDFCPDSMLARRLEIVTLGPPTEAEMLAILQREIEQLDGRPEIVAEVAPLILSLSEERPGSNPAAALRLLEAVVLRAAARSLPMIGPDEVLHLAGAV